MNKIDVFTVTDSLDRQTLISAISDHFHLKSHPMKVVRETIYDTFDWRLYNSGMYLVKSSGAYQLNSIKDESPLARYRHTDESDFRFWWELDDSEFKSQLRPCLDVRAVQPVAELTRRRQSLRILNPDEKTVLYVHLEEIKPKASRRRESLGLVAVEPIRGYVTDASQFKQYLGDLGLGRKRESPYLQVMRFLGKQVGEYSSKLRLNLSDRQSALQATRQILMHLFETMRRNEEGIIADVDTEFLHDYRVAIRRTRSALTQIKGVLPRDAIEQWKTEFAKLGKLSNNLRDLDVYLMQRAAYEEMLPEDLRPGLNGMFRRLEAERKRELRRVARQLQSASCGKSLGAYRQFLDALPETVAAEAQNATKPVREVACKLITKRHRSVIKRGSAITDSSPDDDLHALRIDCKKLRYLMEFFASLFAQDDLQALIKQLKKLQDNLGEFNDLYVQQQSLREFLDQALVKSRAGQEIAALGGLIAILNQRQQFVRRNFSRMFARFGAPNQTRRFKELFG